MSIVAHEDSKNIYAANQRWVLTGLNYSTLGFSVAGTISAGNLTVEVSVDGRTWQAVDVFRGKTALGSGQVITAGTYRSDIAGYSQVSILASSLFSGSVQVFADPSPAIISTSATGGTSLTYTLPLDLTGDVVSILGLSTVGTAGQFPMSDGTDWEYVSSTGTGSVVRATSPTITSPTIATSLTLSFTTVSLPVIMNASNQLVTAGQSGTGTTFAMTASPTFTGTVSAASLAMTGTLTGNNTTYNIKNSTNSQRIVLQGGSSLGAAVLAFGDTFGSSDGYLKLSTGAAVGALMQLQLNGVTTLEIGTVSTFSNTVSSTGYLVGATAGVDGTFEEVGGATVTVTKGIITAITP